MQSKLANSAIPPSFHPDFYATELYTTPPLMSKLVVLLRRPGWSDLPRDLLECILGRLPVADRLRFPSVCSAWQSAAAGARLQWALSPWLMVPFNPTMHNQSNNGKFLEESRFLSLSDGRAYTIPQRGPTVSDGLCIGSSDGWLVMADAASELHLLNPLTGAQIQLPSVATLPFVDTSRDVNGRVISYSLRYSFADDDGDEVVIPSESSAPDRLRYELYEKAILVSKPRKLTLSGTWGGYSVMLIYQPLFRIALAQAGDIEWTQLDTPSRCWVDAVRARGREAVYTMDSVGRVQFWDMDVKAAGASPMLQSRVIAPPCCCCCSGHACSMCGQCCKYLVELAPGHLLQVHRCKGAAHARYNWEPRPEHVEYTTAKVYLFECAGDHSQWTSVDGKDGQGILAGRALFLGKNASLCVPVAECPELRGGCIYFTDDGPWSYERCHSVAPDVGVFDLTDGSYGPPLCVASRHLLWKWPPPVWVFPACDD